MTTPLDSILAERERQRAKWGDQSHLPDGTGGDDYELSRDALRAMCDRAMAAGTVTWRHILREEVAEAIAETDPTRLRAELVQVAAVCVQWIEAIDGRAPLIDLPDQTCPACGLEHPGTDCQQPDLFGGAAC